METEAQKRKFVIVVTNQVTLRVIVLNYLEIERVDLQIGPGHLGGSHQEEDRLGEGIRDLEGDHQGVIREGEVQVLLDTKTRGMETQVMRIEVITGVILTLGGTREVIHLEDVIVQGEDLVQGDLDIEELILTEIVANVASKGDRVVGIGVFPLEIREDLDQDLLLETVDLSTILKRGSHQ